MTKQRIAHIFLLVSAFAAAGLTELAKTSHAHWVALALALVVNLRTVFGPMAAAADPPEVARLKTPTGPGSAAMLLLFLGALGSSCAGKVPAPVIAVGNCAVKAVHDEALQILADVTSALATGDWEANLLALVVGTPGHPGVGEDVISCAVEQVLANAQLDASRAAGDVVSAAKVAHAQAWLAKHPVKP